MRRMRFFYALGNEKDVAEIEFTAGIHGVKLRKPQKRVEGRQGIFHKYIDGNGAQVYDLTKSDVSGMSQDDILKMVRMDIERTAVNTARSSK